MVDSEVCIWLLLWYARCARLFSNLSSPMFTVTSEESYSPQFRDDKIEAWGSEIQYHAGVTWLCYSKYHTSHMLYKVQSEQSRKYLPNSRHHF